MLILTRGINKSVMISGNIKITVLNVKGKQVSLGIDAPKDIAVFREEIYNCIQAGKDNDRPTSSEKPTDE